MARRMKHFLLILFVVALLPALVFCVIYANAELGGNIHALPTGNVYRAGQLSARQLEDTITEHGIRSIINLRGGNYDEPWYQDEITLSAAHGIPHIDYALSAKREVTTQQAKTLLELMRTAPKPLLIHCRHGADRSGIASALYMYFVANTPLTEASQQLSWRFGHTKYHYYGKDKMDISFERLTSDPAFQIAPRRQNNITGTELP
jgi:protein tyrosine phosphatase (PTP) superfamily phosphohydrolase (DUF442 family)